jgi:hypothetical protein
MTQLSEVNEVIMRGSPQLACVYAMYPLLFDCCLFLVPSLLVCLTSAQDINLYRHSEGQYSC